MAHTSRLRAGLTIVMCSVAALCSGCADADTTTQQVSEATTTAAFLGEVVSGADAGVVDNDVAIGTRAADLKGLSKPTPPSVVDEPMETHGVDIDVTDEGKQFVSIDSDPLETKYSQGVVGVVNVELLDTGESISKRDVDAIVALVNGANGPETEQGRIDYFRKNMCSPILRATAPEMWDLQGKGGETNNEIRLESLYDTRAQGNIVTARGDLFDVDAGEKYTANMAFMFENDRWTYCTN